MKRTIILLLLCVSCFLCACDNKSTASLETDLDISHLLGIEDYEKHDITKEMLMSMINDNNIPDILMSIDGTKPNTIIETLMEREPDLIGVLYVPNVAMKPLPLYRLKDYNNAQAIGDKENAGVAYAMYSWRDHSVHRVEFGDHNYQNFYVNKYIPVDTVGYVNMGNRVLTMVCVSMNLEETLDDYNESVIRDSDTITTITCYEVGTRTVHRWVVMEDSDVSFDDLFNVVGKYHVGQRDSKYAEK